MVTSSSLVEEIVAAQERIEPFVRRTYLEHSPFYSELTGANVYFKCENLQLTGSFKLRGALSKFLSLEPNEQRKGVVAASTGNHGKAVAFATAGESAECTIFAPENADPKKLREIERLGSRVVLAGSDCIEAEREARAFAEQNSSTYISPYNDPLVVAGQGTIGFELCNQLDHIDAVFASVGGGGLISGVATYVGHIFPDCRIVGCSPENSNVMIQSLEAGEILDRPSLDTLSDGTAGGVEAGAITFGFCRELIDHTVSVPESEIAKCLIEFITVHGMLIEGAAAVAIAGLLACTSDLAGKNVVVILCGANMSLPKLARIVGSENA